MEDITTPLTLFRLSWKDLDTGETGHGEWLTREWIIDGYVTDLSRENPRIIYWKETKTE